MPKIRFRGKPVDPIDLDALPEYADWIKDGWVYGYLIGKDVIVGEIVEFEDDYFNTEFWCRVRPETVGHATGLMDINGRDIYEGDIVKVEDCWDVYGIMAGEIREVIFAYGGFRMKPKRSEDKGHWLEDGTDVEVIGNIHDNPELLDADNG